MNVDVARIPGWLLHGVVAVAVLVGWHSTGVVVPRIPTPFAVVSAFEVQVAGGLLEALRNAMYSIAIGYVLATVVGVSFGLVMGLKRYVEEFFYAYVIALYVTPISAVVPAMIIWFGTGQTVRIVAVFLFAVFPIIMNTIQGAKTTPPGLVDVAHSFGASYRFVLSRVVLPHEIPFVVAGMRLGIGRGVQGLIIAELLISATGIGGILARWSAAYRLEGVFSIVILLMTLGVSLTWLLAFFERQVVYWETDY